MGLFGAVSADEIRAAQIVTGATLAAFLMAAYAPGLRKHAGRIRLFLLVAYLLISGGFVAYVLLR